MAGVSFWLSCRTRLKTSDDLLGLRYNKNIIAAGAQTRRPWRAGGRQPPEFRPARGLLGGSNLTGHFVCVTSGEWAIRHDGLQVRPDHQTKIIGQRAWSADITSRSPRSPPRLVPEKNRNLSVFW